MSDSQRTIDAHALYFINTGEFYAEHKQLRDALTLFGDRTTELELQNYLYEIALSLLHWIERNNDYYRNFIGTDVKIPDRKERKLIAAEILDHWSEHKLTKEINNLFKAKI